MKRKERQKQRGGHRGNRSVRANARLAKAKRAVADKWMAQVRAWASSFPRRDHVVNDSRESFYGDDSSERVADGR